MPRVMGIINVTPDSFYSSSRKETISDVLTQAEKMLTEGATFLDVGGYSSRPTASRVNEQDEIDRIIGPIEALVNAFPEVIVSVDTFRSNVARKAVDVGARIINDISGGNLDPLMLKTVAELRVPYIAMHMKGTPQTMVDLADYDDILKEVFHYFSKVLHDCNDLGINDVIIDPGFGFAKKPSQGFFLLKNMEYLQKLNKPLLVGLSRKSMIYKTLGIEAKDALNGTTSLNTLALLKGANILRVHDVKEAVEVIKLIDQIK